MNTVDGCYLAKVIDCLLTKMGGNKPIPPCPKTGLRWPHLNLTVAIMNMYVREKKKERIKRGRGNEIFQSRSHDVPVNRKDFH